jgi:hypothetical protein
MTIHRVAGSFGAGPPGGRCRLRDGEIGRQQRAERRQGERPDDHPGAEGVDEVPGQDRGEQERDRPEAADAAVMEARVAPHRRGRDEVVARDDRGLRDRDERRHGGDRGAAVHQHQEREGRELAEMARHQQAPGSPGPVREGEERRGRDDPDDDRDRHHEADEGRGQALGFEPHGKERQVEAEPDKARRVQRRKACSEGCRGGTHRQFRGRSRSEVREPR